VYVKADTGARIAAWRSSRSRPLQSARAVPAEPGIVKLFSNLALFVAAMVSAQADAAPYTIAAVSADADAVVLAAPDGRLQRLRRGDSVPQSAWRVDGIHGDRATFARTLPGSGAGLAISAARGETIDFAALDQRQARAAEPAPVVESHVIVNPARTR
jgi:hypothetical protein